MESNPVNPPSRGGLFTMIPEFLAPTSEDLLSPKPVAFFPQRAQVQCDARPRRLHTSLSLQRNLPADSLGGDLRLVLPHGLPLHSNRKKHHAVSLGVPCAQGYIA